MRSLGAEWTFAHGIGGGSDLPIPVQFAIVGAAWALVISFVVMAMAWREPKFRGDDSGSRCLPGWPRWSTPPGHAGPFGLWPWVLPACFWWRCCSVPTG
jgi:hypothetical protein